MKPYPYTSYPHTTSTCMPTYRGFLFLLLRPLPLTWVKLAQAAGVSVGRVKVIAARAARGLRCLSEKFPGSEDSLVNQIAGSDHTDPETVRQEILLYLSLALADPAYRDYLRQIPCHGDPEALLRLAADYAAGNHI